jgi:hypothetical protein
MELHWHAETLQEGSKVLYLTHEVLCQIFQPQDSLHWHKLLVPFQGENFIWQKAIV